MGEIPKARVFLSLVFAFLSYLTLSGYESLAFRYIKHPLAFKKVALGSFIGNAFSHSVGFALLTGSAVRYRLYTAWGLSALEIANVIAFAGLTFWLGLLVVGGGVFLLIPIEIPGLLHFPFHTLHPIGAALLILAGSYLLWCGLSKKGIKIREWEFALPSLPLALAQTAFSSFDWFAAGCTLYVLLPPAHGLTLPAVLGFFLLAQIAGMVSQIPGGLGVFETVMILLLKPFLPAATVLGALLTYRAIYYLIPLILAAVLQGAYEALQRKEGVVRTVKFFGQWVPQLSPNVFALTTFVGGVVLLFSGATPTVKGRLFWLKDLLPLPVMELSHFLGSLAGAGLLLLARGIQRRLDAAYHLTVALLIAGILASLFKGLDVEEAIILTVMLLALLPARRHFYRKASLGSESFTPGWIAAILLAMASSIWLGFFAYKRVAYSQELWWQFTLHGDAPRFLRATVGAVGVALLFAISRLLRPAGPEPRVPGPEEMEQIKAIVQASPNTSANLALLGDKSFLFNDKRNTFIMYGIAGRTWVALGDPIGPEEEMAELVWKFRELCDRHDGRTVFSEVGKEHLPLYLDLGLTLVQIGEEARVPLDAFNLEGGFRKGFRHTLNKLEKEGCAFEVVLPEGVPTLLSEFKGISDAWLALKNTREKGFSLGYFDGEYLKQFPAGIVRKNGKIVAFLNLWLGAGKEELSLDMMRYNPEAPEGVMDFLFLKVMLWGKQEGYRWFNLGMVPLSGLEKRPLAPLWTRLGTFIYHHGENFYNFQGLRQYKEKFDPVWKLKYLALPGGLSLPWILTDLVTLSSRGLKGIVAK
jgi:phosphatidylglycerol lysyltransferase